MRKTLAIATTAGAIVSMTLVGSTSAAADDCAMQRLPQPSGSSWTTVSAGSPSSDWLVGSARLSSGGSQLLIWHNGELKQPNIHVPDSELTGVSDNGLAVGTGVENDGEDPVSFAHQNGQTWTLPTVDKSGRASVEAISADGRTAVGSEEVYQDGERVGSVPVRWTGKRLQNVQKIAGPEQGEATGVDGATVVGSSGDRAYLWSADGKHSFLPQATEPSTADAVRGKYAVGEQSPADDTTGSVLLWNLDQDTATKLPDPVNEAYDVNSSGAVAVSTTEPSGGDAAVVKDGRVHTLPSLGGGGSATAISDDGVVAGTTHTADGKAHPVLWRGCAS